MADIEHEFLRHVRREADALLKMINKQLEQKGNVKIASPLYHENILTKFDSQSYLHL